MEVFVVLASIVDLVIQNYLNIDLDSNNFYSLNGRLFPLFLVPWFFKIFPLYLIGMCTVQYQFRWQMLPTLLVALLNATEFFFIYSTNVHPFLASAAQVICPWSGISPLVFSILLLLISLLLLESMPVFSFPPLKGIHTIATRTIVFDIQKEANSTKHLVIKLFYPTPVASIKKFRYAKLTHKPHTSFKLLAKALRRTHLTFSHLGYVRSRALLNAPIEQGKKYPLVIFSHGLFGDPHSYHYYCQNLASKGYIVAAPLHTDQTHPGVVHPDSERVIVQFKSDKTVSKVQLLKWRRSQTILRAHDLIDSVSALLGSQWCEHIENPTSYFAAGHSFGGASVITALTLDSRLKCCIGLDSYAEAVPIDDFTHQQIQRLQKAKIILLSSDLWNWDNNLAQMRKLVALSNDMTESYQFHSTRHHNFNDTAFWLPKNLLGQFLNLFGETDIDKVFDATMEIMFHYFSNNVQNDTQQPLEKHSSMLFNGAWNCPENENRTRPVFYGQKGFGKKTC